MPAYDFSVAASTAVVGYDLLSAQPIRTSDVDRVVTGVGMMGSAAALDTEAHLMVGQSRELVLFNRTTGAPNMDDVLPVEIPVPAGSPLQMPVVDAPATNPANVKLIVEDLE